MWSSIRGLFELTFGLALAVELCARAWGPAWIAGLSETELVGLACCLLLVTDSLFRIGEVFRRERRPSSSVADAAVHAPRTGGGPRATRPPNNSAGTADVPITEEQMGEQLLAGFRDAAAAAVRDAHNAGLAVPADRDGVAVEIRPGGETVRIDETAPWSPTDWKKSGRH